MNPAGKTRKASKAILLTVDVEDWFQVENFKRYIPFSTWDQRELRVERNTHRLLDLLDGGQGSGVGGRLSPTPKATFFILGWLAERLPHLVREIHSRGHEVASHGFLHELCTKQSLNDLKGDLTRTKKKLEDIIGAPICGYRAPSFSINEDILRVIAECGYLYDSSYNSFSIHGRYGTLNLSQNGRKGIAYQLSGVSCRGSAGGADREPPIRSWERLPAKPTKPIKPMELPSSSFYELPVTNLEVGNITIPWSGGAYFRLLPLSLFELGVRRTLKKQDAYVFYMHPWEVDPEQPRVNDASINFKFRHYTNLNKTASKLLSFINMFSKCSFLTCSQYLQALEENNRTNKYV